MQLKQYLLAGLASLFLVGPATAEDLTVFLESAHPNSVSLRFYSTTREYLWPDNEDVFIIDDNEVHGYPLACEAGEQICYGAWVRGDESRYWGVGPDNTYDCEDCCFRCEGGETAIITLTE